MTATSKSLAGLPRLSGVAGIATAYSVLAAHVPPTKKISRPLGAHAGLVPPSILSGAEGVSAWLAVRRFMGYGEAAMKPAAVVLMILMSSGCARDTGSAAVTAPTPVPPAPAPPAPGPASTALTSFWGMVIGSGGACLEGAAVEAVAGQAVGQRIAQTTPCDYWGDDGGFTFTDLTPGVEMTLRASAPGHDAAEVKVVPLLSGLGRNWVFAIELTRSR